MPIGTDEFERRYVRTRAEKVLSSLQKHVIDMLAPACAQSAYAAIFYSYQCQMEYLYQHVPPRNTAAVTMDVDEAIVQAAAAAVRAVDAPDAVDRLRMSLPARMGGMGLRRYALIAPAAFVATLQRSLQVMLDRVVEGGTTVPGMCPSLATVLGAGSFDHGHAAPFAAFVASGTPLAADFVDAWGRYQEALGDDVAALTFGGADLGSLDLDVHLQKRLTADLHSVAKEHLERDLQAGGVTMEPRRHSYYRVDQFSMQWVTSFPTPQDRLSPTEYAEVVAL